MRDESPRHPVVDGGRRRRAGVECGRRRHMGGLVWMQAYAMTSSTTFVVGGPVVDMEQAWDNNVGDGD